MKRYDIDGGIPTLAVALSEHMLRVLPNLAIAAIGAALAPGDRLALDAYAVRVSDLVWRLEATKLLAATEEGRSVGEIREFLAGRSGAPLPDTVGRLLADVADRCVRVHDRGLAVSLRRR